MRSEEGIQSVEQLDDMHVKWAAEIRGERRHWTSQITEQQPDEGSLGGRSTGG